MPNNHYSNQPANDYNGLLREIRKFASWTGEAGEKELGRRKEAFTAKFPKELDSMQKAIEAGQADEKVFTQAYHLGISNKNREQLDALIKSRTDTDNGETLPPWIEDNIYRQYEKGIKARQKTKQERKKKKAGEALSSVHLNSGTIPDTNLTIHTPRPNSPFSSSVESSDRLHPNDIRHLKPVNQWELLIDETGKAFDQNVAFGKNKSHDIGRMVGLLIPANRQVLNKLPKNWHAVEVSSEEIDHALQSILNAPVGVFGLEVIALPVNRGERWMDAVAMLIDWVLRLMPLDGPTTLHVKIEQRGEFTPSQPWSVLNRECLRRLALAFPERSKHIELDVRTIPKSGSAYNGYVDAIAYTWARTNDSSKHRLRNSKLEGTCLLSYQKGITPQKMLDAWNAFAQGTHTPSYLWWEMATDPHAQKPETLLHTLLKNIGRECQSNTLLWNSFLNEVKSRMTASPINLQHLAAAVDWLQDYQPVHANIPPTLRLPWLTVNLARRNHEGHTIDTPEVQEWIHELKMLSSQIYDEAAPLVCHADLHFAVEASNRFEFDYATTCLDRWKNCRPAEPGLRYWAQVQSSLGQHAAFRGDNRGAVELFRQALAAFDRLSDPDQRKSDQQQTRCYLVIALMDEATIPASLVKTELEHLVGDIEKSAEKLAKSDKAEDRYLHHVLLRWLTNRGDEQAASIYLNQKDKWSAGAGHPWPLIEIYRALLLHESDPQEASDLALRASNLAFESKQGPVVNLIGACCRTIASNWGRDWPEGRSILANLEKQLPSAVDRIQVLKMALDKTSDPLKILSGVLPFNFR